MPIEPDEPRMMTLRTFPLYGRGRIGRRRAAGLRSASADHGDGCRAVARHRHVVEAHLPPDRAELGHAPHDPADAAVVAGDRQGEPRRLDEVGVADRHGGARSCAPTVSLARAPRREASSSSIAARSLAWNAASSITAPDFEGGRLHADAERMPRRRRGDDRVARDGDVRVPGRARRA